MYNLIIGLIIGFIYGGLFFYRYGKKMTLDLHLQYRRENGLDCLTAVEYERARSYLTGVKGR